MTTDNIAQARLGRSGMVADSVYLISTSILITALHLVIGLLLVRILVPEQYGRVAYFLKVFGLARLIGALSLGAKVVEDISRYSATGDRRGVQQVIYTLGLVRLATAAGQVLVLALLTRLTADPTFVWAGFSSFWAVLFDHTRAVAKGFRQRRAVGWLSAMQSLLFLVGVLGLIVTHRSAPVPVYALFATSHLVVFLVSVLVLRAAAAPKYTRGAVSWPYLRQVVRPLVDLSALGILSNIYLSLGALALGQAKLFEEVAYLNTSLSLVTLTSSLSQMVVSAVLYPDLVAALARDETSVATRLLDTFIRGSLLILVVPTGVLIVYPDVVVRLLYTAQYEASIVPLTVMAVLTTVLVLQQILSFGLFAIRRVKRASQGLLLQVVLLCCGTWAAIELVQEDSLHVISTTYVLSALAGTLIQWMSLKRELPFATSMWHLVGALLVAGLSMVLGKHVVGRLLGGREIDALVFGVAAGGSLCLWVAATTLIGKAERQRLSACVRSRLVAWCRGL